METFLSLDYPTWWFLVVGGLFSGYAILDGFDFGAGAWHLLFKKEENRRIALNAVGPVWDGNEVWLVIGGGALFAGFRCCTHLCSPPCTHLLCSSCSLLS
jgi:cytochrome d ubiquinol oxidase subunit II